MALRGKKKEREEEKKIIEMKRGKDGLNWKEKRDARREGERIKHSEKIRIKESVMGHNSCNRLTPFIPLRGTGPFWLKSFYPPSGGKNLSISFPIPLDLYPISKTKLLGEDVICKKTAVSSLFHRQQKFTVYVEIIICLYPEIFLSFMTKIMFKHSEILKHALWANRPENAVIILFNLIFEFGHGNRFDLTDHFINI